MLLAALWLGVALELSTHPLADLHLPGTAHLALNCRVSLTARSQSQAGAAGRGLRLLTQALGSALGSCEQEGRDAVPSLELQSPQIPCWGAGHGQGAWVH